MALGVSYAPQFVENLEAILKFYDERNGSDVFLKSGFSKRFDSCPLVI